MLKRPLITILALTILIFSGCAFADEKTVTDSQFVMLYVDLSFAAEQFLSDSVLLAQVQDSVFEAHDITRDEFDLYKIALDKSPERWSEIWQMVALEIEKREEAIKSEKMPSARGNRRPKD